MKKGTAVGVAVLAVGLLSSISFAQNEATSASPRVTTSTSAAGLNQIQPQDVSTGRANNSGVISPANFPPTPTPKPPAVPMTQTELDAHVVPSKIISETSNVISLSYSGFRRSQIDPCGCVTHQLGGIDKEAGLLDRLEELKIPTLKVDAGGFLRDMPTDRDIDRSKGLLRILGEMEVDAINVAFTDVGIGVDRLKGLAEGTKAKLISANVVDSSSKPIFDPYVIKEATTAAGEKVRVGIIGVTRPRVPVAASRTTATVATPAAAVAQGGYVVQDPTEVLNRVVPEVREKADVVVVLLYDRRDKASNTITKLNPEAKVDIVITSEWLSPHANIMNLDNTRVVSAGFEGRQMGLLTLAFEGKAIKSVENQFVEILQTIPPSKRVSDLMQEVKGASGAPAAPEPTPAKLQL